MKTPNETLNMNASTGSAMQIGQPFGPVSFFVVRDQSFAPTQFGSINMSSPEPLNKVVDRHFDRFNDVFEALSDA